MYFQFGKINTYLSMQITFKWKTPVIKRTLKSINSLSF